MSQERVNVTSINNVKAYNNQIASQKRKRLCEIARSYVGKIYEEPVSSNKGPTLLEAKNKYYKEWSYGDYWCAAFTSAMAGAVDSEISSGTQSIKTMSSVSNLAGVFSTNPLDAQVGLSVQWGYAGKGHTGIIINVQNPGTEQMIVTVAEGNTTDKAVSQERDGWIVALKTYNLSKLKNPGSRSFTQYSKFWQEDNDHIGKTSVQPDLENNKPTPQVYSTNNGVANTGATKPQIITSFRDLAVSVTDGKWLNSDTLDETITTPKKEIKSTKNPTDFEAKQISEPSVKLDKILIKTNSET